jgi:hypothetical protein
MYVNVVNVDISSTQPQPTAAATTLPNLTYLGVGEKTAVFFRNSWI